MLYSVKSYIEFLRRDVPDFKKLRKGEGFICLQYRRNRLDI